MKSKREINRDASETEGKNKPTKKKIIHRENEYSEQGFAILVKMQECHFWYRGRHRFLLDAVNRYLPQSGKPISAIDFGGGAGGWLRFLAQDRPEGFAALAMGDSSKVALSLAESVLPHMAKRYHIDLMELEMSERWDAAFLLDVIEHLPDDLRALKQIRKALKPGGYLFVTAPAISQFWSYNDVAANHLRRYRRRDFARLANKSGLKLCDARYFMFFLSPLYLLSRMKIGFRTMKEVEKKELIIKQHEVPPVLVNSILSMIFEAETPIGHWLRFPWGTSILGIYQKQ